MPPARQAIVAQPKRQDKAEHRIGAGDFDAAKAKQLITRYYGSWKAGYRPPKIEPEPPQTAPRELTVTYPGQTLPIITVNFRGLLNIPHSSQELFNCQVGRYLYAQH